MSLVGSTSSTHLLLPLIGLAGGDIDFRGFARMLSFSASQGAACRRSSSERLGKPGSLTLRVWWAWLALKRCKGFRKLCLRHSRGDLGAKFMRAILYVTINSRYKAQGRGQQEWPHRRATTARGVTEHPSGGQRSIRNGELTCLPHVVQGPAVRACGYVATREAYCVVCSFRSETPPSWLPGR